MEGYKLSVLGGSSANTPELFYSLSSDELEKIGEICLYGRNKKKGEIVKSFIRGYLKENKISAKISFSSNLKETISNSKIIINQIRVGGLKARKEDWAVFKKNNIMCDEATSPGCMGHSIRGINLFYNIGQTIKDHNPDAILVNVTNPCGLFTDVFTKSGINAIGSCEIPQRMVNHIKSRVHLQNIQVDYIGINHLSWILNVYNKGRNINSDAFRKYEHYFSYTTIKYLNAIPSPYLRYFLNEEQSKKESLFHEKNRIIELLKLEQKLLNYYKKAKSFKRPALLEKRGAVWYKLAIAPLIAALLSSKKSLHYVNVRNNNLLSNLSAENSIEVAAWVNDISIQPIIPKKIPPEYLAQMVALKEYESLLIDAVLRKSKNLAINAVTLHPLIHSAETASSLVNSFWKKEKEYIYSRHN